MLCWLVKGECMWVTYFNGDIYVKFIIIQFQENVRKTNSSKETARAKNAAEMTLKDYLQSRYVRSDSYVDAIERKSTTKG